MWLLMGYGRFNSRFQRLFQLRSFPVSSRLQQPRGVVGVKSAEKFLCRPDPTANCVNFSLINSLLHILAMEDKKQLLANAEIPEDLAPPPYSGVSPVIVHPQCQQHFTDNTNGFDRNSPRYRTCCCHVTVGSMVFAILDLIFAKLTLVVLIVSLINLQREENILTLSRHGILAFWVIFGFAILQIVFSWLLLYGVRKSRNCLLLPDMVLKGIYIAVAMVSLMLCVWLLVVNDELSETLAASGQFDHAQLAYLRQMGTALISGALIYYLLLITYYSYYLHVLQRCYRYIAEKNFHQFNQNVIVYKVEIGGDINKPQRF